MPRADNNHNKRHEVLDRVFGEEPLEFAIKLRCQGLVGRHD